MGKLRYARLFGCSPSGLLPPPICIEIAIQRGIPRHTVVGLAAAAVRESMDRIRAAIQAMDFEFPRGAITVNLAPADIRKEGAALDLPIALGILAADGQMSAPEFSRTVAMGELMLDGRIRAVRGAMASLAGASKAGLGRFLLPTANLTEAEAIPHDVLFGADSLRAAVEILGGVQRSSSFPMVASPRQQPTVLPNTIRDASAGVSQEPNDILNFDDVVGQSMALEGLVVAAAGGHNVLLEGPPGRGKTMMARRFPSILPDWSHEEAIEASCIHSLRRPGLSILQRRPFRSPHHSSSLAGMVGGGRPLLPGEVSLAHHGVLFLDELPEFGRTVLESLREPLEEGVVTISRAEGPVHYPAAFHLVAAMNPCACGFHGSDQAVCVCSPAERSRYRSKLSGPLLDRIDVRLHLDHESVRDINGNETGQSHVMRKRVLDARSILESCVPASTDSGTSWWTRHAHEAAQAAIRRAEHYMRLSMRSVFRLKLIARTVAALEGCDTIEQHHVASALRFRKASSLS